MSKIRQPIFYVVIIAIMYSCRSNDVKIYKVGKHIIKDVYGNQGEIRRRQYFSNDTLPDGAEIDYFPDGKIAIWRWYKYKDVRPCCVLFYNKNGVFDSLKGNPFLHAIYVSDTGFYLQGIKPPQLAYIVEYNDVFKGKLINTDAFKPSETDTIDWIAISHHKFEKDHIYNINFCIIDTVTNKIQNEYHEKLNLLPRDLVK